MLKSCLACFKDSKKPPHMDTPESWGWVDPQSLVQSISNKAPLCFAWHNLVHMRILITYFFIKSFPTKYHTHYARTPARALVYINTALNATRSDNSCTLLLFNVLFETCLVLARYFKRQKYFQNFWKISSHY